MITRDYSVDGIVAKIKRANEHIENLNSEINSLIDSNAYHFVSEPNADATESIIRIVGPEPPLRFSTIIGDAVNQLRSSLDFLVHALIIKNGNSPTRRSQFPICDDAKKFKEACGRGIIKGVSTSAEKAIKARQPYRNSKNLNMNFLYILRELSNTDKHRNLVATYTIGKAPILGLSSGRPKRRDGKKNNVIITSMWFAQGLIRPTEEGTEIVRFRFAEPEPYFKVDGKPVINIIFGDPGALPEQPVVYILRQLAIKTIKLIKSFESELS